MINISKIIAPDALQMNAIIMGMRNPLNSWDKSDSSINVPNGLRQTTFNLGERDDDLMRRLCRAGSEHRKYMRMMVVYMDITAPLYWWKEYDTYKVGTVANSCSTMHKISAKEFEPIDFSWEYMNMDKYGGVCNTILAGLNTARDEYITAVKSKVAPEECKELWWQMIQLLPSSYNQKRTVMLNYEVLSLMYKHRHNHKLDEWREFCDYVVNTLPYSWLITGDLDNA